MTEADHVFVGNPKLNRDISLHNEVKEVPLLAAFVDEICEALELDTLMTMQINLALEEAVVNVMQYAYPADTHGHVHISVKAYEKFLYFIIVDDGMPFDPTTFGDVDISQPAEERNIGGLGIHLVKQIMDSVNYDRVDGQNVLTMRKNL